MARTQLRDLLDGYEEPRTKDGEPLPLGKRFFVRELSGVMTAEMKRHTSGRFYKLLNTLSRLLTYTRSRSYGVMAVTFGFLAFVFELLGYYFGLLSDIPVATLITCGIFCLFGVLLLFFDKPIAIVLQDTPVLDFIFFDFFCIQRIHRKTGEASIHPALAAILGTLFAFVSLFISPLYIVMGVAVVLFVTLALGSPEFSYITSILLLPYLDFIPYAENIFIFTILLAEISFLMKVMWGKRVIYFEQYDLTILFMMFVILASGIFIKGIDAFASAAVLCVMSLGYFLTSSIITNRRLADRVMNSVVVTAIPVSLVSLTAYIVKCFKAGAFISPAESAFFGTTAIGATFFIVAVCFSVAHVIQSHAWYKKLSYTLALVLNISALLLTGEVFAVFALAIGFISYFVFKLKRPLVTIFVPVIFVLPFAIYILPNEWLVKIFDFIPSSEGFSRYLGTLVCSIVEFGENCLLGIGIGEGSFVAEMAAHNITALNSGNLFLELALEAGVFALLIFVFLIISRIRHRIKYYNYFVRDSVVKHSQPIVGAAVSTLIFYGMFSYIWADMSMFYLFFVVFAVESAMLRVSRRARDERILYYEDAKSNDSSAVDISLLESID